MKTTLLTILAIFLAVSATAGSFEDGRKQEQAGNYQAAITLYEAALAENPDQAMIHRQIGVCYYRLGQYTEAVDSLDKYLAKKPSDTQTADFVKKLREKASSGVGGHKIPRLVNTAYAMMFGGVTMLSAPELPAEFATNSTTTFETSMGRSFGGALGYQVANGMYFEIGYHSGPSRTLTAVDSDPVVAAAIAGSNLTEIYLDQELVYMAPGYNLLLGNGFMVGGQLGIGLSTIKYIYFHQSGMAILPELRVKKVFDGQVSFGLGLGYQSSTHTFQFGQSSGTGFGFGGNTSLESYDIENSGLTIRLTLTGYFDRVIR